MHDVGQTLLNWASAFVTLQMVEYLLENGADVNRGLKSSSLHYAACFCHPSIATVQYSVAVEADILICLFNLTSSYMLMRKSHDFCEYIHGFWQ
uniref:Uncharacterized protein n=1 Tax=Amphimedon queenslandica TaxID=400682 RepID=A0A1X7TF30_AMPQE